MPLGIAVAVEAGSHVGAVDVNVEPFAPLRLQHGYFGFFAQNLFTYRAVRAVGVADACAGCRVARVNRRCVTRGGHGV